MRAEDEDVAYNRDVIRAIREAELDRAATRAETAETRTEVKDIRAVLFRAINLLHTEVEALRVALEEWQASVVALRASVERWQWIMIGIVAALILIVIIALSIMLYIVIHRHPS